LVVDHRSACQRGSPRLNLSGPDVFEAISKSATYEASRARRVEVPIAAEHHASERQGDLALPTELLTRLKGDAARRRSLPERSRSGGARRHARVAVVSEAQLPRNPAEWAKAVAQIFEANARQLTLFDRDETLTDWSPNAAQSPRP